MVSAGIAVSRDLPAAVCTAGIWTRLLPDTVRKDGTSINDTPARVPAAVFLMLDRPVRLPEDVMETLATPMFVRADALVTRALPVPVRLGIAVILAPPGIVCADKIVDVSLSALIGALAIGSRPSIVEPYNLIGAINMASRTPRLSFVVYASRAMANARSPGVVPSVPAVALRAMPAVVNVVR